MAMDKVPVELIQREAGEEVKGDNDNNVPERVMAVAEVAVVRKEVND